MSGNAITNFYTLQDKKIMGISQDAAGVYMSAILNEVVQKCKKICFVHHDLNLTVSSDFLIEERGGPVS